MSKLFFCFLFYACVFSLYAQGSNFYFASWPCLSPDGSEVVFGYEGDLWKGNLSNGVTFRITAMQGIESRPKISPDGKWIAFTGTQYGNADIFIMPISGGEIKQLTFHDSPDLMESWAWDSKSIYFQGFAENGGTTYQVKLEGGTPQRLFPNYFNRIHNVAIAPNGDYYFNDTGESANQAYRKRYKGPYNPEIQSYNPNTQKHTFHTQYDGKDMWPTIDKEGNVYFVSDENNGNYNLYTLKAGKKIALTKFEQSIKHPNVSANGKKIVFIKDYQVWVHDVASGKINLARLNTIRNYTLPQAQSYQVGGNVTDFDVSPDGKKMAFSSRGALFVSDIKGKFVKKLFPSNTERIQEVKWINNDSIIFNQTYKGYPNLYLCKADGNTSPKQLTKDEKSNAGLSLNKEKTLAIYQSGRDELKLMNLKDFTVQTIIKDEFWALQSDPPTFSPNGEYVMYMPYRNFEKDILLYHIDTKKTVNLTNSGVTERSAIWSVTGEDIYFLSNRFKPSYPFGNEDAHIYKLPLADIDSPFKSDKFNELWKSEKKPEKDSNSKKVFKPIKIDTDRIMERMRLVSPEFGTQNSPYVTFKDNKTIVLYISDHDEGKPALWKSESEPFETTKTTKVADISSFDIREVGGKAFILSRGKIHTVSPDFSKVEAIDIDFTFTRTLQSEFAQMFEETWAGIEENFYNETFHGLDWKKMKASYASFLPNVNSRSDFREMMQDMLGELNSSHTGFSSSGTEEKIFYKNETASTGIMFDAKDPYKVDYLVARSPAARHSDKIKKGDELIKINGVAIDPKINRDQYFTEPSALDEVILTMKSDTGNYDVKLKTISSGAMTSLLYEKWIDGNQARVDELSNNEVAYVHMRNMSGGEYDKFVIDMTQDYFNKKALILDLRYNTGGNVHDKVLNFLSQKPYLNWKYREGKLSSQPNFAPAGKPIILLINEQSLSDAEMTTAGFKELGLGKVIGVGTYRWIIFTSGKGLADGSFYRLPSWGCYTLDGKNLEATGVDPDILVKQTFTDRLQSKDPQIERAIEEIKKMWK